MIATKLAETLYNLIVRITWAQYLLSNTPPVSGAAQLGCGRGHRGVLPEPGDVQAVPGVGRHAVLPGLHTLFNYRKNATHFLL